MKHTITVSTVETLTILKALKNDLGNDTDNEIAKRLEERIKTTVANGLKRATPTDLTNK